MSSWPTVEAMPHAKSVLASLHPYWTLCLATNAADSRENEIRDALSRGELDQFIDHIYCYQNLGHRKPQPAFFTHILEDLDLPASQVIMVGDDYDADIQGAIGCGISAVWLHSTSQSYSQPSHLYVIQDLSQLPALLAVTLK